LTDNLPSGEFIRFLVHAPAFSTGAQNSPATVLAIGEKGWLVASENEDGASALRRLHSTKHSLLNWRQFVPPWLRTGSIEGMEHVLVAAKNDL
jgi:hypothetical protein